MSIILNKPGLNQYARENSTCLKSTVEASNSFKHQSNEWLFLKRTRCRCSIFSTLYETYNEMNIVRIFLSHITYALLNHLIKIDGFLFSSLDKRLFHTEQNGVSRFTCKK